MGDACDFPWPSVRNFHGIVLSQLEMDRITWGDQDRIGELRQTYVQRGPAATNTPVNNKKRYCLAFQDGTCRATSGEHASPQGLVTQHRIRFFTRWKGLYSKGAGCFKKRGAALGIGGFPPHCPVNSHGYLHQHGSQSWDHAPDTHTPSISDSIASTADARARPPASLEFQSTPLWSKHDWSKQDTASHILQRSHAPTTASGHCSPQSLDFKLQMDTRITQDLALDGLSAQRHFDLGTINVSGQDTVSHVLQRSHAPTTASGHCSPQPLDNTLQTDITLDLALDGLSAGAVNMPSAISADNVSRVTISNHFGTPRSLLRKCSSSPYALQHWQIATNADNWTS